MVAVSSMRSVKRRYENDEGIKKKKTAAREDDPLVSYAFCSSFFIITSSG